VRAVVLAAVLVLAGCTAEEFAPLAGVEVPQPGDALTLELAPDVDVADVESALSAWRAASGGRINVRIGTPGDARLELGPESRFSRLGRVLVIERAIEHPEARRAIIANMVGQMLGMSTHEGLGVLSDRTIRWPLSDADVDQCRAAGWC
jgi:hypothetical protein